ALGIACGTHPTAALLLPGVALYVVWRGRPLLSTPAAWAAVAVFAIVNASVVAYKLHTRLSSLATAQSVLSRYRHGSAAAANAATSLHLLGRQTALLEQLLAGPLDFRLPSAGTVLDPLLLVYLVAMTYGLAVLTRRSGGLLLPLCGLSTLLGMAYLNTEK